jgi:hypothetical protein
MANFDHAIIESLELVDKQNPLLAQGLRRCNGCGMAFA